MLLTRERLTIAGWLNVIGLVLIIPNIIFNMWLNRLTGVDAALVFLVRDGIALGLSIYPLLVFRQLLAERFAWRGLEPAIKATITLSIAAVFLNTLLRAAGLYGVLSETVFGLLGIGVGLWLAYDLRHLPDNLYGLRDPLARVMILANWISLGYFALGALGSMGGLGVLAAMVGILFILVVLAVIVLGIISGVYWVKVFWRAESDMIGTMPVA